MLSLTISRGPRRNPRGHRVQAADVSDLCHVLNSAPTSRESWWSMHSWSGDHRSSAAWESASGVMVDVDYLDAAGAHAATSGAALAAGLDWLPGNLWHPTPRGARFTFAFDRPVDDADLFERAALGAGGMVADALRRMGLLAAPGLAGYEVDAGCLCDLSRLMYCPRATVEGVARDALVEVVSDAPWSPEALAEHAPAEVVPRQRPEGFTRRARPLDPLEQAIAAATTIRICA